jgi:biopolymer transport protein ExbB/TolQ
MANPFDRCNNPRIERLAPFVGLAGTTYGILRAFNYLDSRAPNDAIFPGILDAILDAILAGFVCVAIVLLVWLVWNWLSTK